MMNQPNGNFNDHWKALERILGDKIPFLQSSQLNRILSEPDWIEKYVQSALQKAMPHTAARVGGMPSEAMQADVFETHRSVIARVNIPEHIKPDQLRIHAGSQYIRLEGLSEESRKTIALPSRVSGQRGRAVYKDGILEIRMPKDEAPDHEREIRIQY